MKKINKKWNKNFLSRKIKWNERLEFEFYQYLYICIGGQIFFQASRKIGQYAELAQKEAIAAMDETTRKVFRDNVQMSEVMGHHIERKDELEKKNTKLTELLKRTKQECEINEITGKRSLDRSIGITFF